jgi:methylsterol monooxygenase
MKWCGYAYDTQLPNMLQLILQLLGVSITFEIMFYYIHRMFHTKPFYGWFHKKHHEWTAPIAIAALYAHPVEHVCANSIPFFVGQIITNAHPIVMCIVSTFGTINVLFTHSGFNFPFYSQIGHDQHHEKFMVNFGFTGILNMDVLHGTNYVVDANA